MQHGVSGLTLPRPNEWLCVDVDADLAGRIKTLVESPFFPFEGDFELKVVKPGQIGRLERDGEGRSPCAACVRDEGIVWRNDRWRIVADEPSANPVGLILETTSHLDVEDISHMSEEFGRISIALLCSISRLGSVGRAHMHRWGDGSSHFHTWFRGRPQDQEMLEGWGNILWSQVLPPVGEDLIRQNHRTVIGYLTSELGGEPFDR